MHKRLSFVRDHAALAIVDSESATTSETTGKQRRPSMITRSVDLLWLSSKIDKFQSRAWWAGSFLIAMRLMQTSAMVFFVNPGLQATAASLVALIGVAVQTHAAPYRNPSDNHAALAAAWLLFLWSFVLLVRHSGAVDGQHGVALGALLIATTVLMVMFVVRSLAAEVKKDAMDDEHESSSDGIGVETGALPSVVADAQTEPGEEAGKVPATGRAGGPSAEATGEDATIVVERAEDVSILGVLCGDGQSQLEDTTTAAARSHAEHGTVARLQGENARLRKENEELRRAAHALPSK